MDFKTILTSWYSTNKRDLPWRKTQNPYFIWLSEIILQQTQIKQGLPYYIAFTETFPSVFDLANATEDQVLKLWQGLGYYSRARNLHASAKFIAFELNGIFPDNYKDLLKLRGVGDYTASAIASICFGEPKAVVDGNVYRVLSRYFGITTPINTTKGVKEFKTLAMELMDFKNPGNYNQAIMDFGSRQCKPKNPNCNLCPLRNSCIALSQNKIDELPVKIRTAKAKVKYFNFLVFISNNGKTRLEKRTTKGIWQNLYQFPLIESNQPLCYKDLKNNQDIKNILNTEDYNVFLYNPDTIIHKLSHQHLHTKFWIIETQDLRGKNVIDIASIQKYPVPILIGNFLDEFNFNI